MKNRLLNLFLAVLCLISTSVQAQITDTTDYNFGIWQYLGAPLKKTQFPEIEGRLQNFFWKDLEIAPDVWNWVQFDSIIADKVKDSLPLIYMVYTKDDAPEWLYTNGVPKVDEKDAAGNITGYSPYYIDPEYKFFFKRMITRVREHVETMPDSVRRYIVGVQACFGSTGDYISYKGTVDVAYRITAPQFFALFQEFSTKYYDEYKNTNPKITVIHNPKNNGPEQLSWVLTNCPGGWIKTGSLGKGFQLNDEKTKNGWLYNPLNLPQSGSYIRSRCEIISDALYAGWWTKKPYQNMFAIMCYGVYWGLDWTNQGYDQIIDARYDPAFHFYNKYAGEKDPLKAVHAMSALKDVLDAADGTRFPAATFGTISRSNATRYNNIALAYQAYGAKLEDPASAILSEDGNTLATGTNDVGWDLLPGNYERWLRQLTPNSTSVGYWNIESADTTTVYGRFGRGFELATGKDRLNFDVDSNFLGFAPLNSQYPVIIEVTYLDRGYGSWSIVYDGTDSTDKTATTITNTNTNLWKKVAITINDAYFGNRGLNGTDFSIRNAGNEDVIFTLVELTRSSSRNFSNVGLFASPVQPIADVCVSDSSAAQYFTLTGSFLNGSDVVVGPLPGYSFALSAAGTYSDSLVISNYGAQFNLTLYTKLSAATPGIYAGNVPINGGGFSTNLNLSGQVVDSRPEISANISGITCFNARNAAIDLVLTGGTGPFTYSWINDLNNQKPTEEDIDSLPPATYTVTVSSYAGCKTTASYTITQPDVLVAAISSDTMICKNTTTNVYVSATGGTLPYTGTGTYNVGPGYVAYMVTDANGCTDVAGMVVENATLTPPLKPVEITGAAADETGLCTGGDFAYEIAPVSNATMYTWTLPAGTSISSANGDSTQIMLNAPAGFSSGILSVSAGNVCGTSLATSKVLNGYPAKPGTITGINTILPSTQGLVYSVPAVAGVTYNWTVPAGASIVAGQGTSSITVNWGAISGNVNVKAQNDCGISLSTILSVTVASGVFVTSVETLPAFETVCINGLSAAQSFNLSATGLSGEDVVVGPVTGFKFSPALNGQYRDTLVYADYGTSLNRVVYVKFSPVAPESYNVAIPISGGAGVPTAVNVSGSAVNSSPLLSANINNVTCFGLKNGSIDLVVADGVGPFTYNWIGGGATATYDPSAEDINGLAPLTYTVTVGSYAGCTTTASFTVTQPDPLDVVLTADTMYCKNSTTSVNVSGTGGTLPYSGTGTFTGVSFGTSVYTITDANGCTDSKAIFVPNGVNLPPLRPGTISAPDADAKGVCGGGIFNFSIDPVATATSYTWIVPASGSFSPANTANTSIALTLPAGISTDTVRVIASNVCGSSPAQTKLIIAVPGKPAAVSGPAAVLPSQQGVVYSVVPAVEGIQYKWTVPSGATIVSGLNTPSITVNFGTNGGNINVRAQNACGNSTATILAVSVSTGIFTTSVGAISDFDTTCVNGLSAAKSFTFSATGLSGSAVVVGPVAGFKFSKTAGGAYTDSLIYTGYGTALSNQNVFVRFNPSQLDLTSGAAVIRGGGTPNTASVALSGYAVNSSPILTGVVTDVTCNGLANGAVDLTLNGGTGPFTYSWVGPGTFNKTVEDAVGLSATNYTVNVGSYAGCTTSATFTINQPDAIVVSVTADPMLCKNSTTAVYVSATGGVAPYTGTGVFSAPSGTSTYTVTDANGCAKTGGVVVPNGTGLPPAKPVLISGAAADASGLCGGGSFTYSIDAVAGATSYTWKAPANCTIGDVSPDGLTATLVVPAGFSNDTIKVSANNECGTSADQVKLISAIPVKPAIINGPSSVLPGQTVTYSVDAVPGVTYNWTTPVSVSILSGQNTSTVTVRWGLTSGNISVKAVNACGSSVSTGLGVGVISKTFASSVNELPAFDTLCISSSGASKSFTLTAIGLNGNTVTVGPLAGFTFSTSNTGSYTNTLALNGYGTSLNVNIFVKYNPTVTGTTSGIIPVSGGGAPAAQLVSVTGNAVNSRPTLSAVVTNITCNGAKNGAIDLSVNGGTGPFTYQWVGTGTFDKTVQDISGLSPVTYTVTVGSYAGCTTTGSYQVTQPATLVASLTADPMLCRNSTTNVYVNATGGTLPYTGTGTVTGVAAGTYSYTVTDSKGCVSTKSIIVANGTGTPPAAPGAISSTLADATGVCGTGPFAYSIAAVNNATSYNWTLPSGTTIVSGAGTTAISLAPLGGFTSGTLSVAAVNACGISGASGKAINASPAKPGAVSGPAAVLKQQSGIVYSVPAVAGLTYTWTVPASVTIQSGQGTNTLTIKWGNANTGNISVRAVNSCGQSAASSIAVSATTAIAPSKLAGQESLGFNTAKAFTVYPNPAKDYAYFTFDAGAEYRYTIDIMDISGRQVIRQTGMANKGSNVVRLNVHGLANGMYMVSLVNEQGERKTVKLVKE